MTDPVDLRLLAALAELGKTAVHELAAKVGMDPREVAYRLVSLSGSGLPLLVGVESDPGGLRAAISAAPPSWAESPQTSWNQGGPHQPGSGRMAGQQPMPGAPTSGSVPPGSMPPGSVPPGSVPSGPFPAGRMPPPQQPPSPQYLQAHQSQPVASQPYLSTPLGWPGTVHGGQSGGGAVSGPHPGATPARPGAISGPHPGPPGSGPYAGPGGPSDPASPGQGQFNPLVSTWGVPQTASWARGDEPRRSGPAGGRHGRVGEVLATEGLEGEQLTVQLLEVQDPADYLFGAAGYRLQEGERAVVVHTEITNRGAAGFASLPDNYLELVTEDGAAIGKAPVSLTSRPPHKIGVRPGETLGGHTVYLLPDATRVVSVRWSPRPEPDDRTLTWAVEG